MSKGQDMEEVKGIIADIRNKHRQAIDTAYKTGYQKGWEDCKNDDGIPKQLLEMGYKKGIEDERNRMIKIVEHMQETAQAMMNGDWDYACERFLAMIKKEDNNAKYNI